jgi:hypothetical protein
MAVNLPLEPIALIGQYSDIADQLSLRAVSRDVSGLLTPLVFYTLLFHDELHSVEPRLTELDTNLKHLRPFVRAAEIRCGSGLMCSREYVAL